MFFFCFFYASAMLKHVIGIGWTSVCLSVRLSVTRWYCIKTAEHIVMLLKTSGMAGRCVGWLSGSVSGIRESVSCEKGI